jgi:tetratricopeptide (TPR) repeat protein
MRLPVIVSFLVFSSIESAWAQNAYVRLGQQAYIDGNFRAAITQLEKGCLIDSTNANALWMLGYSYYHSNNYNKSIAAFTRQLNVTPTDGAAYYYRARARFRLGKESLTPAEKEKHLIGAIYDFTKAITVSPNDAKIASFYQNRAIAYRDYGAFKLEQGSKAYDKDRGVSALKAAIADLKKVLESDPNRSDIALLLDGSKEKLAALNGHH